MIRRLAVFLLAVFSSAGCAFGQLELNVTGVAGSGVTNWEFVTLGPAFANADGTIRDITNNTFAQDDSGQFPAGSILDSTIQNQILLFGAGSDVQITLAGNSEVIGGIFLDEDGGPDDIGIRTNNPAGLSFLDFDAVSWSGSGTIALDITTFTPGNFDLSIQSPFFGDVNLNFAATAIPEPASLSVLGLAGLGLLIRRRR